MVFRLLPVLLRFFGSVFSFLPSFFSVHGGPYSVSFRAHDTIGYIRIYTNITYRIVWQTLLEFMLLFVCTGACFSGEKHDVVSITVTCGDVCTWRQIV